MLKFLFKKLSFLALLSLYLGFAQPSNAKPLQIYASIKPVQGIVEALIDGTDMHVGAMIPDGMSPHHFVLTPGSISKFNQADLLIWIGPQLEGCLIQYFKSGQSKQLQLINVAGLKKYAARDLMTYMINASHHHHDQSAVDGHIWLNTDNVKRMGQAIAAQLIALDSSHKDRIQKNLDRLHHEMDEALKRNQKLLPSQDPHYFVMHDAYQYFEKQYGLMPDGVVHIVPHQKPSAKHLNQLIRQAKAYGEVCFFSEPQLGQAMIQFFETYPMFKKGMLDPLGKEIEMDKSYISKLFLSLSDQYHSCFKQLGQ